jgi:hypothetical protein
MSHDFQWVVRFLQGSFTGEAQSTEAEVGEESEAMRTELP